MDVSFLKVYCENGVDVNSGVDFVVSQEIKEFTTLTSEFDVPEDRKNDPVKV